MKIRAIFSGELRSEDPVRKYFPEGFVRVGDVVEVEDEEAYLLSPSLFEKVEEEKKEEVKLYNWNVDKDDEEEVEE